MPIIGLTDQSPAFPVIGVLRKGEAKPESGNRPGKDLTYFRFTSEDTDALETFNRAYPDEDSLRRINVYFPNAKADENFDAWIEKWIASSLIYRSDGETVVRHLTDDGKFSDEPKPDPKPEEGEDGKRKDGSHYVGRMSVIVKELGRLATVTVLTTSKWDIINLTRQLKRYEQINGDLRGVPFVLCRTPQKISTPAGNGKRARREKWLLSIEPQPEYTRAIFADMERRALPAGVNNEADIVDGYQLVDAVPVDDEAEQDTDAVETEVVEEVDESKEVDLIEKAKRDFFDDIREEYGYSYQATAGILKNAGYVNGFDIEKIGEYRQAIDKYWKSSNPQEDGLPF